MVWFNGYILGVQDFKGYIRANESYLVNYGDRYRNKETISSAFVESTVNEVISKRFVKKQQMRWSKPGAHLLLQVRIKVLNEDWRSTFCSGILLMKPATADGVTTKAGSLILTGCLFLPLLLNALRNGQRATGRPI